MRWCAGLVVIIGCVSPAAIPEITTLAAPPPPPRTWRPLGGPAPFAAAIPELLTDGTVMIQELDSTQWWRLTPDPFGGYEHGTWAPTSPMPAGYTPLYYAAAVLTDGRLIVEGGEYLNGNFAFTNRGAIYDPLTDRWFEVQPPMGWAQIGDASGMVLANGTFMLSACCTQQIALLDANSLAWTPTGNGKADINDEESWAMLRDDTILTVDANNYTDLLYTERYTSSTGEWLFAGDTVTKISDTNADMSGSHEVGPELVRADGTVLAIGATGHNGLFNPATATWQEFPDTPLGLDVADGPGVMLPNGDILIASSPGVFATPTHFFEIHDTTFTEIAGTPHSNFNSSYANFFLALPTGEILLADFTTDVELYTPAPGAPTSVTPVILAEPELVSDPPGAPTAPIASLYPGRTYSLRVLRMNGGSQGAYYGDDVQSYTNYPIVRLTNAASGHVVYCRTSGHSNRSIAPDERGTTRFDVPMTAERGPATLSVIANGVQSPAIDVNVR